jgi:putative membrane protein
VSIETPKLDNTAMALDRTWLAHERTLMAWVRTSTSMISFAFTIYKFFQFERPNVPNGALRGRFSPRDFAILMASIGVVALLLATIQHAAEMKQLKAQTPARRFSIAGAVAILISIFGLAVLISAIFRQ